MGNGESISMWTDKWLPANSSHRVLSPIQILDENAKVSELIDKEREEWKSDLVKQLLCPHRGRLGIKHSIEHQATSRQTGLEWYIEWQVLDSKCLQEHHGGGVEW